MDVVHLASQFLGKCAFTALPYISRILKGLSCVLLQGQKGCAGSVRWALDSAHR